MTFKDWKNEVDHLCAKHYGLGVDDLPDWLWFDAYQDCFTPEQAFDNFVLDVIDEF
jgi:hypothetical protein